MKGKTTLRDNLTWKETLSLAEYMYERSSEIAEIDPDEKYASARKLKESANNLLYYAAQAITITKPSGEPYEWRDAKKYAFAMQSIYIFASRQKYIKLDPKLVVRMDNLITNIDNEMYDWEKLRKQIEKDDAKPVVR